MKGKKEEQFGKSGWLGGLLKKMFLGREAQILLRRMLHLGEQGFRGWGKLSWEVGAPCLLSQQGSSKDVHKYR